MPEPLSDEDIRVVMDKVNFTYNPTLFARAIESIVIERMRGPG